MDITIAAMTDGERASLCLILARGLASLPKAQRADGVAAASVERLQSVLRDTPSLDAQSAQALMLLAFRPRGLRLTGVNRGVMRHLSNIGHVTRVTFPNDPTQPDAWQITRAGWLHLWNQGRVQTVLTDRYGIAPVAPGVGE